MNHYQTYMDRQQVTPELHDRLLAMEAPKTARRWQTYAALAACAAVIVGLGIWKLRPAQPDYTAVAQHCRLSDTDILSVIGKVGGDSGAEGYTFSVPELRYPTVSNAGGMAADIALPDGAITVELTEEQIQLLLSGRRESVPDELPGYLQEFAPLTGRAVYDGYGKLWQITLYGEGGHGRCTVELAPGGIPPTCVVYGGGETADVFGTEVSTWGGYAKFKDGTEQYRYESTFLTGDVGVRATFVTDTPSDVSNYFVAFACYPLTRPDLTPFAVLDGVPDFRSAWLTEYGEALAEPDFVPYLPQSIPEGFDEFRGKLTYQEGVDHHLVVWWRRGTDSLHLYISLPEGGPLEAYTPVDIDAPETWDLRLYGGNRWDGDLPFELLDTLEFPTFRAEDMTRDVIEARLDTVSYQFHILHPDGTAVEYSISGLTVDQLWAMIEPTL